MVRLSIVRFLVGGLLFTGCSGEASRPDVSSPPSPRPPVMYDEEPPRPSLNEIRVLKIETYDGSDQVVHPDVAQTPARWSQRRGHMVITPYPYGSATDENPSVFRADNGLTWRIPKTGMNPIARPRGGGYLSDPDEIYNPETHELWIYYREVSSRNEIYLMKSRDGMTWGAPEMVVSAPNHQLISPAVVRRSSRDWLMWSVNSGGAGCSGTETTIELRTSTNGTEWSAPRPAVMKIGEASPWHLDVAWIESRREYWAVFNAKTPGTCTTPVLYFATSVDGLAWNVFPTPLLARGAIAEFQDVVYRSTFEYDDRDDEMTFWYSGARYDGTRYVWKAAMQRLPREAVFALATLPVAMDRGHVRAALVPRVTKAPPLTNRTAP